MKRICLPGLILLQLSMVIGCAKPDHIAVFKSPDPELFYTVTRSCFGKEELFVSWIGCRRRTRGGDLRPYRNSKTQRPQPGSVLARGALAYRRSSHQPHRGITCMEPRSGARQKLKPRRIVNYTTSRWPAAHAYTNSSGSASAFLSKHLFAADALRLRCSSNTGNRSPSECYLVPVGRNF